MKNQRNKYGQFTKGNKYQKGHTPWNKDTHIQTNTGKTHFKKGLIPYNKGQKYELVKVNKKRLYQLYIDEKLSTREVAEKMNVSKATISKRLRDYKWVRTPDEARLYTKRDYELIAQKKRKPIDKDKLYQLYCVEKYSTPDLEKVFNAERSTIRNRLKKYGWMRSKEETYKQARRNKKLRDANLGKKATLETRKKLSEVHKGLQAGENHPNWQGGITPINKIIRHSNEYKEWIKNVFERDDYVCQMCESKSGELHANHIKKFSDYPELRFDINNGITLCKNCHLSIVTRHEEEWESYFNFNLETRGFIESDFISRRLE